MGDSPDHSGVRPPPKPPEGSRPEEVFDFYLTHWEGELARARRVVKKRASRAAIWTTALTGVTAVLGAVTVAASSDLVVDVIGVVVTISASASAVIVTWNEHFHHRELWIQRSAALNELQALRRRFELRKGKRCSSRKAMSLSRELEEILGRDLASWTRIQEQATDPQANS